jgi:hypothetical protein
MILSKLQSGVSGEFTVSKDADDYYEKKNDDEVFHLV